MSKMNSCIKKNNRLQIRSSVFSYFQSIFGIFFGDYQYFFVSLQSIYIINIEKFNIEAK